MTSAALFATSAALGLLVLLGGAYGVLYALGAARSSPSLTGAGYACYAGQLLLVLVVCLGSPLASLWKLFMAVSGVVYGFIPPATWRLLDSIHHNQLQ
ncbi:MAG: hypothetical protein JSR67_12830 [Proteobacteria bacterium]|nr:hypothetical protein [Pseudomonadota bacterium]